MKKQRKIKKIYRYGEVKLPKVPVDNREGVFAHCFICLHCKLHFKVYSWREFELNGDYVYCPECGKQGNKLHTITILSTEKDFNPNSKNEIFYQMGV